LEAAIGAARSLYPDRKITGVFQPHLYTRTRDFADGFARALDQLDEIFLMDIYPAREEPIPGVSADLIYAKMKNPNCLRVNKDNLIARWSAPTFRSCSAWALEIDTFGPPHP
jgi:UDP-N-acetylmuramate--alanine ligase